MCGHQRTHQDLPYPGKGRLSSGHHPSGPLGETAGPETRMTDHERLGDNPLT